MSHFAVAVLTDGYMSVDELLDPFDESIVVDKYLVHTREELIKSARAYLENIKNTEYKEYLRDPDLYLNAHCNGNAGDKHYIFISTEFASRYNESDEEILKRELSYYEDDMIDADGNVYTTYNPSSKWDWYDIGGRFSNMLLSSSDGTWHDELPANEIDFQNMKKSGKERLVPLDEAVNGSFFKSEYMKRMYPNQETYELINTSFWTRAVITPDGEWHELGEMGWFGMSSEEPEETAEWVKEYYDTFMKPAIENKWVVHIVDCHI